MVLIAAFIVGFLGSLHCIGMCGGIVGIMGSGLNTPSALFKPAFLPQLPFWLAYNSGRIISYSIAGGIVGFIGAQAVGLFDPKRVQEIGLMVSGSFMLALGLYISGWWSGLLHLEKIGSIIWKQLRPLSLRVLQPKHPFQAILSGLVWGWLPCGLVYSMLVWSMTIATPLGGAMIMAAFGLGTLPMLIGMGAASAQLNRFKQNTRVRNIAGSLIMLFGVLTFLGIVRPFNVPLFSNPVICAVPQ